MPIAVYRARTEENVRIADADPWFGSTDTAGAIATRRPAEAMGRRRMVVKPTAEVGRSDIAPWIATNRVKVVNAAGKGLTDINTVGAFIRLLTDVLGRLLL
jgi:hypothetical protein